MREQDDSEGDRAADSDEIKFGLACRTLNGIDSGLKRKIMSTMCAAGADQTRKAESIVGIFELDIFDIDEIHSFLRALVEVSCQTLPFLILRFFQLSETALLGYTTSLAKSSAVFISLCTQRILGYSARISASGLVRKLKTDPNLRCLLESRSLRQEIYQL